MSSFVFEPVDQQLQVPVPNQWSKVTYLFAAPWVLEALGRIDLLGTLPPNWDGYGSPRIDGRARSAAKRFLASVAFSELPSPHISPVLGGAVGLHWRCGEREMEFTFQPDNRVEFLKILGSDLDRDENMEEGTLRYEPETPGLKMLLWMVGTR